MSGRFPTASRTAGLVALAGLLGGVHTVWAEEKAADAAPVAAAPTFGERAVEAVGLGPTFNSLNLKFYGHVEVGATLNADSPNDNQNFGRLFDDRSNEGTLNQLMLTLERPLAPKDADTFDWGAKFQLMYGSDARFIHYLGVLDNMDNNSHQLDVVEAFANFHLPVLTAGGIDVKVGMFVTLQGAEVIDATGNPLYSHSYSFNFGIPFKHTGIMLHAPLTDWLHLHAGVVGGINTGFDDNNDKLSFHGGFNLTLFDGKVANFTSFHLGAENDTAFGADAATDARFIFSSVTTVQWAEKFKTITDVNYGQDDGGLGIGGKDAQWYGIAQYFICDITDTLALVVRGEVFRDDDGFAVFQFASPDDFIDFETGRTVTDPRTVGGADSTYYGLTVGLNIKPASNILIRPEIRYDWATGPGGQFNDSTDQDQWTFGIDVIFRF